MSVTGLCHICEQAEAKHSCPRCGRLVCETHYDEELGYCTACAAEIRRSRGGTPGGTDESGGDDRGGDLPDEDDVYR